jgi:hypothetical protein
VVLPSVANQDATTGLKLTDKVFALHRFVIDDTAVTSVLPLTPYLLNF